MSSPSNAYTTASPQVSKAHTLPWELEIFNLGIDSAMFIGHKVEIMPSSYLALPTTRDEVLHKNIFIANLNVTIVVK